MTSGTIILTTGTDGGGSARIETHMARSIAHQG
ncbi:hypothetical protein OsI_35824 [Oryza sativa Indica Group]|uniref:Uncharacterized protein n=1 Tax=Oryza sativa subsp. indica TaxID=39946 RepID=B8BK33_ORYSI|nr:hypothetical protein OsI_35824 [Oryza sativa Indica Group]